MMTSMISRLLVLAWLLGIASPARAVEDTTVWLCRPGLADDPCTPGLDTTEVSPTGQVLGIERIEAEPSPDVDCFYVYPTVSAQQTGNANRAIDVQEGLIAILQASQFSQACRVFAPMYREYGAQFIRGVSAYGQQGGESGAAFGNLPAHSPEPGQQPRGI